MAAYDVSGNLLDRVYDKSGSLLAFGYTLDGEYVPISEPNKLIVMSYNIQHGSGINAITSITDEIFATHHPHIIGMQEGRISTNNPNYYYYDTGSQESFVKRVASLFPMSDVTETVYQQTDGEPRSYSSQYFNYNGKRICVLNTHLAKSMQQYDSVRYAEVQELIQRVANEPYFILIGDMNIGRCTDTSHKDYIGEVKPFIDAGYHAANCNTTFGFIPTAWGTTTALPEDGYMCDNIYTSSNISIDSVEVDTLKIDAQTGLTIDHIPLIAHLTIN